MEKLKKIKESPIYTGLGLTKTLINNLTTLFGLLSLFGVLTIDDNTPQITNSTINVTSIEDNENIYFAYFTILPLFFGFVRVINDFINLCKFGNDVPDSQSKGDYIGIFGEDLALVCVETIKKSSNSPFSLLSFISSMYSLCNYAFTGLKIMLSIVLEGIKLGGSTYVIQFLTFVGASGIYVVYRYFTISIDDNATGDMFALYILYQVIAFFHTWIFISILRDKD